LSDLEEAGATVHDGVKDAFSEIADRATTDLEIQGAG